MTTVTLLSLLLVAAAAAASPQEQPQYRGHQVLRIMPARMRDLDFLVTLQRTDVLDAEFWSEPRGLGSPVDVRVAPESVRPLTENLLDQGIPFTVTHEDLERDILAQYAANKRSSERNAGPDNYNFDYYMEYDEMMLWLAARARDCGDRCDLFSIGQTYEGRDMMVMKITDGSGDNSKPGLWVDSGIHAREWIAFAMGCWFIDQLVSEDADAAADILANYDVYVLPAINADGYVFTHEENRLWRKSRMPNEGTSCIGTDLNRNFDHNFGGIGTSANPCSETYHGGTAYSNVESGNVASFVENNIPAGGWRSFLTLHSYGKLWMAPWGYTKDRPETAPELDRVGLCGVAALEAVNGVSFTYGSASQILYESSGTSRDWAYAVPEIPYVYTIELREDSFILPPEEIVPSGQETYAGWKAMVAAIDDPEMTC